MLSVLVRPLADVVDLEAMARDAEMTLDSGDPSAPARFLDLAAAYLRAGHENAAIDACYEALSIDPDDVGLHLALVQLFDDRGWTALATEKLDLLERLVGLGNDPAGLEWIRIVRTERG
ncbi:MAG: tetratricopeptide repeat protein [Chloroflexota bacterium]